MVKLNMPRQDHPTNTASRKKTFLTQIKKIFEPLPHPYTGYTAE
jgi:hypothetical protein